MKNLERDGEAAISVAPEPSTIGEMTRELLSGSRIPLAAVGARIQRLRLRQGLTIRELAELSNVDKNTILRLEKGLPTSRATITLVCQALSTHISRLLEAPDEEESIRVHRREQDAWRPHSHINRGGPHVDAESNGHAGDSDQFNSEEDRRRMSADGEGAFFTLLLSSLPNGQMFSSVLELYGESEARSHPGEEFVYCLSGTAKVTIGGRVIVLREGEAAQFWSAEAHTYAPADEAVDNGNLPVRILSVRLDAKSR